MEIAGDIIHVEGQRRGSRFAARSTFQVKLTHYGGNFLFLNHARECLARSTSDDVISRRISKWQKKLDRCKDETFYFVILEINNDRFGIAGM